MSATFKFRDPDQLEATLTITMTVKEWKRISQALLAQDDGHYGSIARLHRPVRELLSQAERGFWATIEEQRHDPL